MKRSVLVTCAIVFVVFIVLLTALFLFIINFPSIENQCNKFDKNGQLVCGYVNSTKDNLYHHVAGIIVKKYDNNNEYFFDIQMQNAKGRTELLTATFPPSPYEASLRKDPRQLKDFNPKPRLRVEVYSLPAKEIYDYFNNGDKVMVTIATPTEAQILEGRKKLGDLRYLDCIHAHKAAIRQLRSPSFVNKMSFFSAQKISNCSVTIQGFEKIQ